MIQNVKFGMERWLSRENVLAENPKELNSNARTHMVEELIYVQKLS